MHVRRIASEREQLIRDHVTTPYYADAEAPELLDIFWGPDSRFRDAFVQLDLSSTLEIACGHGRHAAQTAELGGRLTVLDVVKENLAHCKRRLPRTVRCVLGNGRDLSPFGDREFTAVYSYDAMVHFEAMDVVGYVFEIARVLQVGGRALLHHSIDNRFPDRSYRDHPCWRNWFDVNLMRHVVDRAGLRVISLEPIQWPPGHGEMIDAILLAERV